MSIIVSVKWHDPNNGDLVKTIFEETKTPIMIILDGKKLPAVSWQGVVNAYNLLYKDHVQLMEEGKHMLDQTNIEG
jgi:hypothetical protein